MITLCGKEKPFEERREKNINARKKNLLRKGSFLLAIFLFQTFLNHLFPQREKIRDGCFSEDCCEIGKFLEIERLNKRWLVLNIFDF